MEYVTRLHKCTVQLSGGKFCDAPMAEGAPYPICVQHAGKVYDWVKTVLQSADPDGFDMDALMRPVHVWPAPKPADPHSPGDRVYYVRIGKLIKIGSTMDMPKRMKAYPPSLVILAAEHGHRHLERRRHEQFKRSLAHRREWFHPSAELIEHVNLMRDKPLAAADLAA